ncbi:MAG: hypothetical protein JXR61_06995 [Prolixibacteraceae bacterium]|nr:hypothetical protein [Prolixibacteraceae bacterium]
MKITVENIEQEYPKINIPLPEPLAKDKFEKLTTTFLPNYDKSEVIKNMVDTFVLKLNEAVSKAKPKPEAKERKTAKSKSKSQSPKPENLTQLKKYLKPGMKLFWFYKTPNGWIKVNEGRTVGKVQGNAITFETDKGESWLHFPKAAAFGFNKDYFSVDLESGYVMYYYYDDQAQNVDKITGQKTPEAFVKKPKATTNTKKKKAEKKVVPEKSHWREDERLIRRFKAAVGKERTRQSILNVYRDIERRVTENKVGVRSDYQQLIRKLQKKLKYVLDYMEKEGLTHIKIELEDQTFINDINEVANGYKIRTSVNLLKRFIGVEGEVHPDKKKVQRLYDAFDKAVKAKKVTAQDVYADEFKEALEAMKSYLDGDSTSIKVSPTTLRGLAGLEKPKATVKTKPMPVGSGVNGIVSDFNAAIKRFFAGSKSKDQIFTLGKPKELLKELGVPDKEIILRKSRLKEKADKHGLTFAHLKNLPNQINAPILVFEYEKGKETFNVVVSRTNKEGLLLCGINTKKQRVNKMEVSEILTIHGRNTNQLMRWIQKGLLLYVGDIDKIKKLFSDSGINRPQSEQLLNIIKTKLNIPDEKANLSGVENEPVIVNRFQVDISKPIEQPVAEIEPIQPGKEELSGLFSPITYNPPESTHDKIDLPGDLGRFLGYVERYEYSILLRGEKGAGKTRMLYQMMNTFAKAGFKVGCFSLEIGKQSNLIRDMRNQYISPTIANSVFIADNVPNGLEDIKAAARQFDVVAIDSWGKIPGTKADDFDKLRKEFPKTMFIVIFQSTTNGTARGGSMPEYDAGIVIQVANGGRAYCEKNRYNGEDLTYLVFQRKLEEPEPQPAV